MKAKKEKKTIKTININVDKCNGCRACEMICSAFHAEPKYSSNNPARARIRVIRDPLKDVYVPVYAGEYTVAECAGRDTRPPHIHPRTQERRGLLRVHG